MATALVILCIISTLTAIPVVRLLSVLYDIQLYDVNWPDASLRSCRDQRDISIERL
jgi:hypothetical protein